MSLPFFYIVCDETRYHLSSVDLQLTFHLAPPQNVFAKAVDAHSDFVMPVVWRETASWMRFLESPRKSLTRSAISGSSAALWRINARCFVQSHPIYHLLNHTSCSMVKFLQLDEVGLKYKSWVTGQRTMRFDLICQMCNTMRIIGACWVQIYYWLQPMKIVKQHFGRLDIV